jgi:hypothetical protein
MNVAPSAAGMSNAPFSSQTREVTGRIHATPITHDCATVNGPSKCHGELIKITKPAKVVAEKMAEKKKRRKKKWKKPKDKPNRPLSAYNFFFRSERTLMLGANAPSDEEERIKKRVHCKTHGKIGFAEMARMIGGKWKALEPEKRKVFEDQAKEEKDRYAAEIAIWKEAQQGKSDDESSKDGLSKGLDAIATAAIVCDQMESKKLPHSPAIEARPSDELKLLLADQFQRRKISLLQQSPGSRMLDYLWALREQRQRETARRGGPHMDSPLLEYPSAAEASANAILQQFQNGQVHPQKQPSLQAASRDFDRLQRLSRYSPTVADIQHVQNRFMANEYAFAGGDYR